MQLREERVLSVHHWNERLFSFKTTREDGFRFKNGHFVLLGLRVEGKPLLRAYSIASANHEEHLEFFSIKVPNGPLTSKLQHLKVDDTVYMSGKPVGTLVIDDLRPGKRLVLLATGTGLAPYMSIIKDPETYERFEEILLVHGVRKVNDLAYRQYLMEELPRNEYLGEEVRKKFKYQATVTRDNFTRRGRITALIEKGDLRLNWEKDRVMLCGSPEMLYDLRTMLDIRGFQASPHQGVPGDYVLERAFVDQE